MKSIKIRLLIASLLVLFNIFAGCKKELSNQVVTNTKNKEASNTNFNWETATTMPVSASSPAVAMPWQSQSGSYISSYLINDYKSNDGWALVYNTFNSNIVATKDLQPAGGLYFALYNRYRGLLRFYLYIPLSLFGGSSSIEHGLSLLSDNGSTTPMLNFEGSDIVDPSVKISSITKTNNEGVAVGGGWYAMQYEIAYDSNFHTSVYPHLGMHWNSKTISISQILLSGTSVGSLNGTITQQSSGFNWSSTLVNGIIAAAETYGTIALATASVKGQPIVNADPKKLKTFSAADDPTIPNVLETAAQSGLSGNVSGFFSGLFGGNSANSQEVDVKMNSVLSLQGTITTSQPLNPNSLVFPGQTTANTVGAPTPLFPDPLGVFNLTGKPTVNVHTTSQPIQVNENGQTIRENLWSVQYTLDQNIFNSLFIKNDAVFKTGTGTATIQNLQTAVCVINPNTDSGFSALANHETIGDKTVYTGSPVTLQYVTEHGLGIVNNQVAVRVSFNVVPNNGAPSSLIVKTFVANLVNN